MNELKILKQIKKACSDSKGTISRNKLIYSGAFVLAIALILAGYFMIPGGDIDGKIAVITGIFGGIFLFFAIMVKIAEAQTVVIKRYIDIDAINNRINVLESEQRNNKENQ